MTETDIRAGKASENLSVALTRFADLARLHLDKADRAINVLPKPLRPAFAPRAVLRAQLRALDLDAPFQPPRDVADWRKLVLLTFAR